MSNLSGSSVIPPGPGSNQISHNIINNMHNTNLSNKIYGTSSLTGTFTSGCGPPPTFSTPVPQQHESNSMKKAKTKFSIFWKKKFRDFLEKMACLLLKMVC